MSADSMHQVPDRDSQSDFALGWTPRSRFEAALKGDLPDRVPFVIWNNKLPGGTVDEALLEAGACVVVKSSLYDVELEGVDVETETWIGRDGHQRRRTLYHTPAGDLERVDSLRPHTVWHETFPFCDEGDYDALLALVESRRFIPRYDRYLRDDAAYGEHGIGRPATESTPMHEIIYGLLGVEAFAREWFDHRDHVVALYNALLDARRRRLPLLAQSPASYFVVEANIAVEIVGTQRFKEYYVSAIEEACQVLHAAGKLAGAHLDGDNRVLAPLVARTSLDFIESFTPPPDCDLSIREARLLWPGKALYCNFPSSVHLGGADAVRARARELLHEAAPGAGFLLGVLEDVPHNDTLLPLAQIVCGLGLTPIAGPLLTSRFGQYGWPRQDEG